jgi:hypothetical protein
MMLYLLLPLSLLAYASDSQGELIKQVEKSLDISIFHQTETDRLIKCFDVNSNGYYAIGYANNTINIYDSFGVFQYGYHFHTDGTYAIELKENSIIIYLGRSNIAVEIDSSGACINAEKVHFSKDLADNVINRSVKQIGNVTYYLERDIGIFNSDYSRLVKVDETGTKTVLYDVTTRGFCAGAFHYMVLIAFPVSVILFVFNKVKREHEERDPE